MPPGYLWKLNFNNTLSKTLSRDLKVTLSFSLNSSNKAGLLWAQQLLGGRGVVLLAESEHSSSQVRDLHCSLGGVCPPHILLSHSYIVTSRGHLRSFGNLGKKPLISFYITL